ncbi:unnamed protein product, partial [Laminaria digitata]
VVAIGGGKDSSDTPWVSVLNVFSGGVFVAAGFMHLLPEADQDLRELSDSWHFQLAPFFASLGFVLMFLLEEVVAQISSAFNPYACGRDLQTLARDGEQQQQHPRPPP